MTSNMTWLASLLEPLLHLTEENKKLKQEIEYLEQELGSFAEHCRRCKHWFEKGQDNGVWPCETCGDLLSFCVRCAGESNKCCVCHEIFCSDCVNKCSECRYMVCPSCFSNWERRVCLNCGERD